MISQAGGTTGTVWGTEVMHWGEAMTSWANTPQHTYSLTISDAAFEEILNLAKENMKVSVPVYSVEGTVVGEYSFVRF